MATLFQGFQTIEIFNRLFLFLLVLFVLYALLEKSKFFGDNKSLHGVIALTVALLLASSTAATRIIQFMTPAFVVLLIFIVFILMTVKIFGYEDEAILNAIKERNYIITTLVVIGIIIGISAVAAVFGQGLLQKRASISNNVSTQSIKQINGEGSVASPSFEENLWATLFHPKILGMVVIFIIALFGVKLISDEG